MIIIHRTVLRRREAVLKHLCAGTRSRQYHAGNILRREQSQDPRREKLGHVIEDEYEVMRDSYDTPKNPVILAHGLLGFEELHVAGALLPGLHYWRGITEALAEKGVEVITATVPAAGRIEARAAKLAESIEKKAGGKAVNVIAGLDARHMISRVQPPNVKVLSLTTIATPHRGSAFADYTFNQIGPTHLPRLYKLMEFFGLETGAFRQLTETYMAEHFNPRTPDVDGVRYYSYGATFEPQFTSVFRRSHRIVEEAEGPNDGLVSVASAQWGTYKGTLKDVSHLDLINWTNRLRWYFWSLGGYTRKFNAIAFYLDIADMLAKEGL